MKHYIGPYIHLRSDFDYRPWDGIVVNARGHLWQHGDPLILIPRHPLDTISRSFYCGVDLVQINPASIVRESGALWRLASELLDSIDDDDDYVSGIAWGIVPVNDEELPSRGHVPGLNNILGQVE